MVHFQDSPKAYYSKKSLPRTAYVLKRGNINTTKFTLLFIIGPHIIQCYYSNYIQGLAAPYVQIYNFLFLYGILSMQPMVTSPFTTHVSNTYDARDLALSMREMETRAFIPAQLIC